MLLIAFLLEELGFEVRAYYNEPGMGFAGVYEDGFDESFDYSGMDADEAEDYLPEALNERSPTLVLTLFLIKHILGSVAT